MRVCLVAHRFFDENTHMRQFATAFDTSTTVHVVGVGRPGSLRHEVVNGNIHIYRIHRKVVDGCGPLTHLFRMAIFLLKAMALLAVQQFRHGYDLIHVQSVPDFLILAAIVPKMCGVPVILDLRDLVPELYASRYRISPTSVRFRMLLSVEHLCAALADHILVANPIWLQRFASRSASLDKCSMLWYYPDQDLFHPQPRRRTDNTLMLLYPGSLSWHQGLDIAIRAFARVLDSVPDAQLRIIGEGPLKDDLVRLSNDLGIAHRILFLDPLPTTAVIQHIADCDIGIVPKRTRGGFGNEAASTKIAEFLAMGIPVVASRSEVDPLFYDESTVVYVRPEDAGELASAILEVWKDRELRDRLKHRARAYAAANRWQVRKQEYLSLVQLLITAPRALRTKGAH